MGAVVKDVYLCIPIDCECDKGRRWRSRYPFLFRARGCDGKFSIVNMGEAYGALYERMLMERMYVGG